MVSSISSSYGASAMAMTRPDPAQMASKLFSKLDTKGQGYIEASDLQSAFNQIFGNAVSSSGSSSDSSALFNALDGDGNGKVTESEFSSGVQKLAEALDSQAFSSRMAGAGGPGGAGGMPPPPPPPDGQQNDTGFTKDQLTSQLQEIGSTDSKRSSLISNIVNNFDKADTNGDGKVTLAEAMAYEQSTQGSASTTSTGSAGSTGSTTAANQTDAMLAHRLMELMRAYGTDSTASANATSGISISA